MSFVKVDNRLRRSIHVVNQSGVRSPLTDYEEIAGKHSVEIEVEDGGEIAYGVAFRPGTTPTKIAARLIWDTASAKTHYRVRSKSIGVRARLLRFQQPVVYRLYSTIAIVRLALVAAAITIATISGVALASRAHSSVKLAISTPTPTRMMTTATVIPTSLPTANPTMIDNATNTPPPSAPPTTIPTIMPSSTPKPPTQTVGGPLPITATPTATSTPVPSPDTPTLFFIYPIKGARYPFGSEVTVQAVATHGDGTPFNASQLTWIIDLPQPGIHLAAGNPITLSLYCPNFCDIHGYPIVGTYTIKVRVTGKPPYNITKEVSMDLTIFLQPPPIH